MVKKKLNHYRMKRNKHIKNIVLSSGLALLISVSQLISAQSLLSYLSEKATIGENPTLLTGNLTIGSSGQLFFGSHQPLLQQTNRLFNRGNYEGKIGARIYLSVVDNSNSHGSRGFLDIVGTATGSTEIVLDMFDGWDGSRIDLARAHNVGSNITAFTMQEAVYNHRVAYIDSRVEGNDRIWFLAEQQDDCLPLIVQKRNNTLVVDNSGGYNFVYYTWFRTDQFGNEVLIHQGAHGVGLGGVFNVGRGSLNPLDTYHAIVTDQHGNQHRTCPHNPAIFIPNTRIIGYPNPTTVDRSLVMIDVETNDEELLANGVIIVYNILGHRIGGETRTNGHRITPIQLPPVAGTYIFHFISGTVQEVIRIVVH
jgi:hypothetical protein